MFKSAFQGGPSFEVFSCQGSSSSILYWRVQNKQFVRKVYEKDVKGYCYWCEKSGKLNFPKDEGQSAYLIQPYLILQVFISVGQQMSMEICDLNQTKRRFFISTAARESKNTALHVTLPIGFLKRGVWLNLCFDLLSLVRESFKGQTFRCLDSIAISGTYRIRKVFTMKLPPPDTTDDYELYDETVKTTLGLECIPRNLQYGIGIDHMTQIINLARIKAAEKIEIRRLLEGNERIIAGNSKYIELPKLAFGSRPSSEVISVKRVPKKTRSAKSIPEGHENDDNSISSQCTSRTSMHTSEVRKAETLSKRIVFPPIVEFRIPREGVSPKASEIFATSAIIEKVECVSSDQEVHALKSDSEEELMNETKPLFFDTESLNGFDGLDLAPGYPETKSNVLMVAPAADEPAEEPKLENEIEAFFKSQKFQDTREVACEESLQTSEQESDKSQRANDNSSNEDPFMTSAAKMDSHEDEIMIEERDQIDGEYLARGVKNMDQILSELDQMIVAEDSPVATTILEIQSKIKSGLQQHEHVYICTETAPFEASSSEKSKDENTATVPHELEFDLKTSNEILHDQTTESLSVRALLAATVSPKQRKCVAVSITQKKNGARRNSLILPFCFQPGSKFSARSPIKEADEDKRLKTLSNMQLSQIKSAPSSAYASNNARNEVHLSTKLVTNGRVSLSEAKPQSGETSSVTCHLQPRSECYEGEITKDSKKQVNLTVSEDSNAVLKTHKSGQASLPEMDTVKRSSELLLTIYGEEAHGILPLLMDVKFDDSFDQALQCNAVDDMDMPKVGQSRTASSEINKKLTAHCEATKMELQRHIHYINEHEEINDFPYATMQEYQEAKTPLRINDVLAMKRDALPRVDDGPQLAASMSIDLTVESAKLGPAPLTSVSATLHSESLQPGNFTNYQLASAAESLTAVLPDDEDETVELMYDTATNSYYDPATGKYYEIEGSDEDVQIGIQ